jgi:hypothetical protein
LVLSQEPSAHFLSLSQLAFLQSSVEQAAADFVAQHPLSLFIIEHEEIDKMAVRVRNDKNFIEILILGESLKLKFCSPII